MAFEKSIESLAILGGVPVFNLKILKPYFFKLSLKCRDGFSSCGPLLTLLAPLKISDFKYVPVVKITVFDFIIVLSDNITPFTVLSSITKS